MEKLSELSIKQLKEALDAHKTILAEAEQNVRAYEDAIREKYGYTPTGFPFPKKVKDGKYVIRMCRFELSVDDT